jgi:5-methylcytosine-specific restriction endonuclease McrA
VNPAVRAELTYSGSGRYTVFVIDESGREIDREQGSRDEVEAWFARKYHGFPLRFVAIRNPGLPRGQGQIPGNYPGGRRRKEGGVTDRALRYRANADPPPGPRICALCGSKRNVEVGHVDGHEENTAPDNLFWTCRSCNVKSGNAMRRAGQGRLTRQYNPAPALGAENLGQWLNAVMSMKGDGGSMTVADAVAMIHATPPEDRSQFASEIWGKRRQRGTDRNVPF